MGSIIESLTKYLLKKEYVQFSKIENSFFLYKELDKKVKLNEDIIKINYLKESPYLLHETKITSLFSENSLYLWFSKEHSQILPEALLVYRKLLKKYRSVLVIVKGEVDKVVIIKEGKLLSSFSKKNISKANVVLTKDEYSIDDVLTFEPDEYTNFLERAYSDLKFKDLLNILNLQIDFKSIFEKTVRWTALPLLITVIMIMLSLAVYDYVVSEERDKVEKIFKKNRPMTSKIKEEIDNNEEANSQFNALLNEFKYHKKTDAISEIIRVTEEMNMTMHYIKVANDKVDFVVRTANPMGVPSYVKKLFSSPYFVDVKNISTFKLRDKREQITMTATLKAR